MQWHSFYKIKLICNGRVGNDDGRQKGSWRILSWKPPSCDYWDVSYVVGNTSGHKYKTFCVTGARLTTAYDVEIQFKDIVTHMQKLKTVKCIFCGVWV